MEDKDKKEEVPKWINLICPSCAIAYGIEALVSALKKKRVSQNINAP